MIFPTDDPCRKNDWQDWWLVLNGDDLVGFAGAEHVTHEEATLCRAGIFKKYQGQGLHRRMIQVRERWARKLGYGVVTTYTMADNLKSANNFIRMGYRLYEPKHPVKGALHFRKEL
jgi:RimJ/RimL family protein N-acetyltransferase